MDADWETADELPAIKWPDRAPENGWRTQNEYFRGDSEERLESKVFRNNEMFNDAFFDK